MRKCRFFVMIISILIIGIFCGCGVNSNKLNNPKTVDKVIDEQISEEEVGVYSGDGRITEQNITSEELITDKAEQDNTQLKEYKLEQSSDSIVRDVDYDLTSMNSDMIYATVFQMMNEPDTYVGKRVRMNGLYNASRSDATGITYQYCIINDATACCAQGIEFIWDDGSHVYPDEYPEENANIVVEGIFETYKEKGDDFLYCRLKDATLKVE